jgi:hypothetical protein
MESKPLAAMLLEEAIYTGFVKIERRSNSERGLEMREGWFQDPDDAYALFWHVTLTDGQWTICGRERMGWEPISVGGWLTDNTWGRLYEIIET